MTSPSAYGVARESTERCLLERRALFRRLVVAVSLIVVVAGVASLLTLRLLPLLALSALPVAVLAFVAADLRRVARWSNEVTALWRQRELRLSALRQMLGQVPQWPARTIAGMLARLPGDALDEAPGEVRGAVAAAQDILTRSMVEAAQIRVTIALSIGASLMGVLAFNDWRWLGIAALVPLLLVATALLQGRRFRRFRQAFERDGSGVAGASWAEIVPWLESLDRRGMPAASMWHETGPPGAT